VKKNYAKKIMVVISIMLIITNMCYAVSFEIPVSNTQQESFSLMLQAASVPRVTADTEFTVDGESGKDSTIVYEVWPFNGIQVICLEDNSVMEAVCMAGYGSVGGSWCFTPSDTLTISAAGYHLKSWNIPVGAKYYYILFRATTGNGADIDFQAYQRRYRW
jgi:hypothetical protein